MQLNYSKNQAEVVWRAEMNFLLKSSSLPTKYFKPFELVDRADDLDIYNYLNETRENIIAFVTEGMNLLLLSANVGNGKTSWAVKLMQRYFAEIAIGNGTKVAGKFISVPSLLTDLSDFRYRESEDFKKLLIEIEKADIVIWDELGGGSLNKANYSIFYNLINVRLDNKRTNIYTTNYSYEELEENLGQRLSSRVEHLSVGCEFMASNVRGMELEDIE